MRAEWERAHGAPAGGEKAQAGAAVLTLTRQGLRDAFAPVSESGAPLKGPIHFWSDPDVGKPQAQAAIASEGTGWTMGQLQAHAIAEARFAAALRAEAATVFPGNVFTDKQLFQMAKDKQLVIAKELFQSIWDKPSKTAAMSGALSSGAQQHNATPGSVQSRIEIPTVQKWGSFGAALDVAEAF